MTKVYVVSSSDRHVPRIEGIFSTEGKAGAFAEEFRKLAGNRSDHIVIDWWEVDAREGERVMPAWTVYVGAESGAMSSVRAGQIFDSASPESEATGWHRSSTEDYVYKNDGFIPGEPYALIRSGISAEHALELAAGKRREWLRSRAMAVPTKGK